jgi:type II restriction/modification system DNA methylase subunit YeeA
MLKIPANPNGKRNADVVRPWTNGQDITRRPQDYWIVFFPDALTLKEAALYEAPFELVKARVKPYRAAKDNADLNKHWWRLWRSRPEMFAAMAPMARQIVTPRVAKHRLFVWRPKQVVADSATVAIARDDDTAFGILHSRFHEVWALRLGTSLEDRPRYTPGTTFETFPFPEGLTPDVPAAAYADDRRAERIARAARALDTLRSAWLDPPDLVERIPEVVPGLPERVLPVDTAAAGELKKRTLTNLYNQRPTWLADAHRALDEAVAAAYGWPADISDEDALARLLALNLERAGSEQRVVRRLSRGSNGGPEDR